MWSRTKSWGIHRFLSSISDRIRGTGIFNYITFTLRKFLDRSSNCKWLLMWHLDVFFRNNFFFDLKRPPTLTSSIFARKLRTYLSMKAKYIMKSMEIELHEIMKSIILGFNPLLCLCMTGPSIFWLVVALVGREASRFWEHHRKHHRVVWKIPSDRWGELREHQLFRLVGARG